ncbi:MAG: lipopolysaccharide transport system ATP-binding protein [Gaiellaceae bacterium]|nr:lipopolysaccharide transport system ATP-binding protein [Gaiellaceae bacterium]
MKPIIEVDGLSKAYKLIHQHQSGRELQRRRHLSRIRRPVEVLLGRGLDHEQFWALRDVTFDVAEGSIVGIVGKNGSGKSTLLKILSRIVEPTAGRAVIRGKTASLLEVGTGFHPELTGRENIFFNGAILGMPAWEIRKKFDEIVEFAEIERFLDTPVKFYSSGMYVRLAFAVAAHIEPDILIVDEVLSVGDQAFQQKSLGKMREATQEQGRTVLFVSHNLGLVRVLCNSGILLADGQVVVAGAIGDVIEAYQRGVAGNEDAVSLEGRTADSKAFVSALRIRVDGKVQRHVPFRAPFVVEVDVDASEPMEAVLGIGLVDAMGNNITTIHTLEIGEPESDESTHLLSLSPGANRFSLRFDSNILRPGKYFVDCALFNRRLVETFDEVTRAISFAVTFGNDDVHFDERQPGLVFPENTSWTRDG